MSLKMFSQMSEPRFGNIFVRLLLIFGYMAFSVIVSLILVGFPEGHGYWEPIPILGSWVIVLIIHSPILESIGLLSFLAIFFLYLIWISLLTTLFATFNKSYPKFAILVFHVLGSFLALSMLGADVEIPDWPFFSIMGMAVFWMYLSLDWRLVTGHKKQPRG